MKKSKNVDDYILTFPSEVQELLIKVRKTIKKAAPKAQERISYQIPAYFQNGILVYFGGFRDHIGFFPTGEGVTAFKHELKDYKVSKGTIHFPLDKPLPLSLISRIVEHRLNLNLKGGEK